MDNVTEFHEELFQDVKNKADAEGVYKEDAFFDLITSQLIDAAEFEEAVPAFYKRTGIRVDGYCGDPAESNRKHLGLIVLDYNQTLELATLTNADMEANFKRAEKFVIKSRDASFRDSLEPTDPGFELADLIDARWDLIDRICIFLLTNKKLSQRVSGKDAGSVLGKEVAYNVWDITRIGELLESRREREPLTINFHELPSGPIRALLASSANCGSKVYLAAVPGKDLAEIYDRWGTRLLEQNVRVFLQARSNVNKGIKRSLENEPELFFSFNNGITATAESIVTEETDEGLKIVALDNLQIVNGGQTTASVYAAYKAGKDLDKVFVQMKLSVVSPDEAVDLVPRISEYANSQNKVAAADFFANHPYHVRIEESSQRISAPARGGSFDRTKWFYERARGSYRDKQAYLSKTLKRRFIAEFPREQTFTKTDLAKYLMVWTDKAYIVNRGAQKNFAEFAKDIKESWDENNRQFNDTYFKYLVAKKIVFDAAGKIVQAREWYETGGYRSQHVVLAVGFLSNAVRKQGKAVDFLSIWNQQALTPAFERAIGQAADVAHEVLMCPGPGYRNISEWAKQQKCWAVLKSKEIDWDEEWLAELINLNDEKEILRDGVREQKILIGIEAQTAVCNAGPNFWKKVLAWCQSNEDCSEKELGILKYAASTTGKVPSEKQSVVLVQLMGRLQKDGCPLRLKTKRQRP